LGTPPKNKKIALNLFKKLWLVKLFFYKP